MSPSCSRVSFGAVPGLALCLVGALVARAPPFRGWRCCVVTAAQTGPRASVCRHVCRLQVVRVQASLHDGGSSSSRSSDASPEQRPAAASSTSQQVLPPLPGAPQPQRPAQDSWRLNSLPDAAAGGGSAGGSSGDGSGGSGGGGGAGGDSRKGGGDGEDEEPILDLAQVRGCCAADC